ncbi:response regulator [Ahrensia kielensis]|uniref:response regulator n=1 Tax=Ahrensia kielensis TaxID=76980 RepID=UPI00035FF351|nr:response regulator [Ahrensia kielensis]
MKNILLIDDDPNEAKLFHAYIDLLSPGAYELYFAETLEESVEMFSQRDYSAVFLDNRLRPFADFRETLPTIEQYVGDARLYVISASINDDCFEFASRFPDVTFLDKFHILKKFRLGTII